MVDNSEGWVKIYDSVIAVGAVDDRDMLERSGLNRSRIEVCIVVVLCQ